MRVISAVKYVWIVSVRLDTKNPVQHRGTHPALVCNQPPSKYALHISIDNKAHQQSVGKKITGKSNYWQMFRLKVHDRESKRCVK